MIASESVLLYWTCFQFGDYLDRLFNYDRKLIQQLTSWFLEDIEIKGSIKWMIFEECIEMKDFRERK